MINQKWKIASLLKDPSLACWALFLNNSSLVWMRNRFGQLIDGSFWRFFSTWFTFFTLKITSYLSTDLQMDGPTDGPTLIEMRGSSLTCNCQLLIHPIVLRRNNWLQNWLRTDGRTTPQLKRCIYKGKGIRDKIRSQNSCYTRILDFCLQLS